MVNSQLLELIRVFKPEEFQNLKLFVASPYHNRGAFFQETQHLLEYILQNETLLDGDWLSKSKAYNHIFPGSPFIEGKLDKVMSELHLLTKDFIEVSSFVDEPVEQLRFLRQLRFYRDRNLQNRVQNGIHKVSQWISQIKKHGTRYFNLRLNLDLEIHATQYLHNTQKDDAHLEATIESLDLYYYSRKIELLNTYLLQQKMARLEIPAQLLETISNNDLPLRLSNQYPVLMIAFKVFQVLSQENPDVAQFEELRSLLAQHREFIEEDLLRNYYTALRNTCTFLVHAGKQEYLPQLFEFQREHYESGMMHVDGKMPVKAFINLVNTALKLGHYEWTSKLLEENRDNLYGDNEDQTTYRLAQSLYHFHTGDFERSIELLPPTIQELNLHLLSRRLELKIYYELNSDLLAYKIDAFKMYLSRASKKVINDSTRERHGNFINLLLQLSQTAPGDKTRSARLLDRIREKQVLSEREWLEEKAEGLKGRKG